MEKIRRMFMLMSKSKRRLLAAVMILLIILLTFIVARSYQEKKLLSNLDQYLEDGILLYGADDSAPPLRFVDDDGVYKGVVVDYMNQISLELGVEIKCVPYKWEDALVALEAGETDMCDMFINEERSKKYVFTDPIYTLRTVMAIRNDENYTLGEINNLTVATQKGDYANWYMRKHYPKAKLEYVHDVGEGVELLIAGKVDAVIGDEPVVSYYVGKNHYNDYIQTMNTVLYEEETVIAVSKEKKELVDALNIAIRELKNKGQLGKIEQKWIGISKPLIETSNTETVFRYFIFALIIAAVFLIFKQYETINLKRQVRKHTKALETSRNELRLIFNEMPEGVLMVNDEKIIVNCNDAAEKVSGKDRTKIMGRTCDCSFKKICGNCETCIIDECMNHNADIYRKIVTDNNQYELRAFYIEKNEAGSELVMITIKDITKEEIQNKQLLLSSKMIAIGQLAAGMAHQIRNPLGIIRTHSYIIRKGNYEKEKIITSLDYIDEGVKRASGIIDNVMNFWRISNGDASKINIREYLELVRDLEANYISNKDVEIIIDCPNELEFVSSEEGLKHILINLLHNAIDALPKKDGKIVMKGEQLLNKELAIQCIDNGCGIPKEYMDNLFNPFFTTKEPGSGTGLGLYIAYSEIENLGGVISVESEVGVGTTFKIRLPEMEEGR